MHVSASEEWQADQQGFAQSPAGRRGIEDEDGTCQHRQSARPHHSVMHRRIGPLFAVSRGGVRGNLVISFIDGPPLWWQRRTPPRIVRLLAATQVVRFARRDRRKVETLLS